MIDRRVKVLDVNKITHTPRVIGGKPFILGLRMTVGTIVGLFASGQAQGEILKEYPYLEYEDLQAAFAFAACDLKKSRYRCQGEKSSRP
jgi:uncharacterized protein (DUF433 family)